MEFTLPLNIKTVFNPNSMVTSSKDRKIFFRVSSCVRSETLSVIVAIMQLGIHLTTLLILLVQ